MRDWETLRKGGEIPLVDLIKVLNYMRVSVPTSLERNDFDSNISFEEVQSYLPELKQEYWYDLFDGISVSERSYIRAMLRR